MSSSSDFYVNTYTADDQTIPDIAINALGGFVITWQSEDQDGDGAGIFARIYSNNSSAPTGTDFRVNTTTTDDQTDPAIAMDANGDFVITWTSDQQLGGSGEDIYAQRYTASGQAIGTEFRVNLSTPQDQNNPDVASDALGNFVVVYESEQQDANTVGRDLDGTGIFAQRFDTNGALVGSEFRINTYTKDDQSTPAIAMNAQGDFVVVWESDRQDGSGVGIFGQRYNNSGQTVGSEFQVNTGTEGNQVNPAVALDESGNFVVTWQSDDQDADGDGYGVYARRYNSTGSPSSQEFLVNQTTDGDQIDPAVSMDANGNFTIAWVSEDQDGDGSAIIAQQFSRSGSRNGGEFQVNSNADGDQTHPAIGLTATSDYAITWQNEIDDNQDILAQSTILKNEKKGDRNDNAIKGTQDGDRIRGLQGDDTLKGLKGNDILEGGSGDDSLQGGEADDTLNGGNNDDTLDGGDGNDALTGGKGFDTFVLRIKQGYTIVNDFENGTDSLGLAYGLAPTDIRVQQQGDNTIVSWQGLQLATLIGVEAKEVTYPADFVQVSQSGKDLEGGSQADTISGTNGADEIIGLNGNDVLSGRAGDDYLDGGNGSDQLYGEAGNDYLDGGNGNDNLEGGNGEDFLVAGNGNDKLIGGANSDIFFLQTKTGTTVIQDFQDGIDYLSLDTGLDPNLLQFQQQGADTVINLGGQQLAILKNIDVTQITYAPSDFV